MRRLIENLKKMYWKLPMPISWKVKFRNLFPQNEDTKQDLSIDFEIIDDAKELKNYSAGILRTPVDKSPEYCDFTIHNATKRKATICAYYLTQYHPTEKNNLWWGKGTTEWTNVSKAVPQYPNHYQPRLPGELGFYDLRIEDNMARQIELAKNYGIDVFLFYFYWFNGERVLERPLEMFLNNKNMDMKFSLCWCNEDWTKRYSGISSEVLLSVGKTTESYIKFIYDIIPYFKDDRYLVVGNKPVLIIYRPSEMPDCENTIKKWREITRKETGHDLFLIASQESNINVDWTKKGFDAISQFQPASILNIATEITNKYKFIRNDFCGKVYDYKGIAENAIKNIPKNKKIFPAVMPMWDNTARRNNKGIIFENYSPTLYGSWLSKAIDYVRNSDLESDFVFINAWNEWGEGAYLEPDRRYGYAFLEETYKANHC